MSLDIGSFAIVDGLLFNGASKYICHRPLLVVNTRQMVQTHTKAARASGGDSRNEGSGAVDQDLLLGNVPWSDQNKPGSSMATFRL